MHIFTSLKDIEVQIIFSTSSTKLWLSKFPFQYFVECKYDHNGIVTQ